MPVRSNMVSASHPVIALLAGASLLFGSFGAADLSRADILVGSEARLGQSSAPASEDERTNIRAAVSTFVWAVSNRQAPAVWHFTSEAGQARLETKNAALGFFARIHPQLAHARQMRFDGIRFVDDGVLASAYILDTKGVQWLARFAMRQDTGGHWKVVNCQVRLAPGDLI